jgi:hypothetical protein
VCVCVFVCVVCACGGCVCVCGFFVLCLLGHTARNRSNILCTVLNILNSEN